MALSNLQLRRLFYRVQIIIIIIINKILISNKYEYNNGPDWSLEMYLRC